MSLRRCVLVILLFWSFAVVIAIGCGIIEAAFVGKNVPFQCDYESCSKPVFIFGIAIISITFMGSLMIQLFVVFSLWKHERKSEKRGDFSSTSKALKNVKRKLFAGFFVFATMAIFEIASAVVLVNSVGKNSNDYYPCDLFAASGPRLQFVISCVVLTLLWTIGLFFDPIFTLASDPMFSQTLSRHYTIMKSRVSRSQRRKNGGRENDEESYQ